MSDVFISYKQDEREAVQIIASSLNDLKVAVWFDTKLRAGGSFDEEISAALTSAKAVLVCWTPAAIESEWVRGEAAQGHESGRYVACFLQPTKLIPPFNLIQTENLCAWSGQHDDPAWIKLLDRIGELTSRPGLSSYHQVMRPGAPLGELKTWANANGADPLADNVWARIQLLEGEDAAARIAREREEARGAGERRKAQAEKSRRLARERGLRDPAAERRRFIALVGSVAAVALLSIGAIVYFVDMQGRDRTLRDEVTTTALAREFIHENSWHPIAARGEQKLQALDAEAWRLAQENGSIAALRQYIADSEPAPQGAFIPQAQVALAEAERVMEVQRLLARLDIYEGEVNGSYDEATRQAIRVFRFRFNLTVNDQIDDALMAEIQEALTWWVSPRLDELRTDTLGRPTEAELVRLANILGVEAATMFAVVEVESGRMGGFAPDGRMFILFEPHLFSRMTNRRYDATNPRVSYRSRNPRAYPRTQEERWRQLEEAYALDPNAALSATSWGSTQILGMNFQRCGFETVGEFVRFMAQSEANQLEATLVGFVRANNAADELQRKDWEGFAGIYNGSGQVERYGALLRDAYAREVARIEAERTGARAVTNAAPDASTPSPAAGTPVDSIDIPDTGESPLDWPFSALLALLMISVAAMFALLRMRRA